MTSAELRSALEDLGVSQLRLARDLGITGRTVRYWVRGTFRVPAPAVTLLRRSVERGYYEAPVTSQGVEAGLG